MQESDAHWNDIIKILEVCYFCSFCQICVIVTCVTDKWVEIFVCNRLQNKVGKGKLVN